MNSSPRRETPATAGETVLAEIPRARGEVLRISVGAWKGRLLTQIRLWYRDQSGELRPGKGVALKPDEIEQTITALQAARDRIEGGA
jgi:hypothetical protein